MDKEWSGPYVVVELCGQWLYRLKNGHGKTMKKKYNSAQLKLYKERQRIPTGEVNQNENNHPQEGDTWSQKVQTSWQRKICNFISFINDLCQCVDGNISYRTFRQNCPMEPILQK